MAADLSPYADAITQIESGGNYALLGPVTKGDRAYGRYQVMGANVPEWTEAALGKRMTPQEFLADPQAQDAVFQHRFGSYVDKYGPEGAARAWFGGETGMNNPNARDVLGTTVSDYARRFNANLGQPTAPPPQGQSAPALMGGGQPVGPPTTLPPGPPLGGAPAAPGAAMPVQGGAPAMPAGAAPAPVLQAPALTDLWRSASNPGGWTSLVQQPGAPLDLSRIQALIQQARRPGPRMQGMG